MTRRNAIVALVALAIVAVYFFGISLRKDSGGPQKVVIAQVAEFFLYAPLYVALDAGLFAEYGIDASIISTGGDEKSWAAVVSGSAQFGVADPTFVAISDQRGQPGRVIASIVNGVPFWGVTLDQSIGEIDDPEELEGYTVATFPSPSTAYTLQRDMFLRGGLDPSIREGAFGALLPMLHSGQADIALELEPNVSTAVHNQNAQVVYSLADVYRDFAITGLTTTPDYLNDNEDTAQRVVCGLQAALTYIHEQPDETLTLLAKRFPDVGAKVAESALARVSADGIVPRSTLIAGNAWEKALQLRVNAGDVVDAKPMDQYVDNRFAAATDKRCTEF